LAVCSKDSLLDNSARPSGAIVYTARDGNLTSEQVERLKSELEAGFQGSGNAGRPLLLEGGLDWKAMSLSPKDMDFIEARHVAAREIALALGVPPMLLGIPGDNTYANLAEAQRTFWRQTVLPLVGRIARELSGWLAPAYPASPPLCRAAPSSAAARGSALRHRAIRQQATSTCRSQAATFSIWQQRGCREWSKETEWDP
jgi:phage portal protein BeeE